MQKIIACCEQVMIYVSAFSTLILMLLTTADAGGRYLFNRPITGAYEITTNYLMVAAIFLSLSYGYRQGSYIRVTLLAGRLRGKVKLVVNYFVQLFSLLYGFMLIYATYRQALRTFEMHTTLSSVDFIPLGPAYVIVPVGLFFMSLAMLLDLPKVGKDKSPLFTEDESISVT
ncbi:MAG TPA: TRAP transporter small permease [Syntrophorhabdales bacterium]|nr:TRAP transporter small permease [Syntrophorhabdales bacterium]